MKRTKRKLVIFSQSQWERVCKCAKALKMKPATYLRNMSLHREWKCYQGEDICFPLKIINHIGTDLNMILEPVHIESKSTQKRVDMRNNTHSFSVNSFNLIVF